MVGPHGGKLINRVLKDKAEVLKHENEFEFIKVNTDVIREVENIAFGVYSPLEGFLNKEDFESVLNRKRLANGVPWTIPIVFDLDDKVAEKLTKGQKIFFQYNNKPVALFTIEEKFNFSKDEYASKIYGTTDIKHPGVQRVQNMNNTLVSGKIDLISSSLTEFQNYYLHPKETRVLFKEKGWLDIVAFQTRNVPHLGHEYVQKAALTMSDGLFINPLIGPKKKGDFLDKVIIDAYKTLTNHYYLKNNVVMSILQSTMHYAGPREAIHHSIMRKNFGCTHFIVGRDHAGVGDFYHPFAAHRIFDEFPDLGIIPLFFRSFSRCTKCNAIVNDKICPHPQKYHINFSGTKIRKLLSEGEVPPSDLMRPEVAETIIKEDKIFVE